MFPSASWSRNEFTGIVVEYGDWLFSNTPGGARSSAVIYSLVETAKENGLNPLPYLTYLFEQLPNINLKDLEALDRLLPWADAIQEQFHIPVKSCPKS